MKFWFFAILLPGLYAFTDSLVDSSEPTSSAEEEVFIKSLMEDEGHIRVATLSVGDDNAQKEILDLCSSLYKFDSAEEDSARFLLAEAFNLGKSVKVRYGGHLTRCIAAVRPQP